MALKFCSSWSISVMLGTVVAIAGFLMAHFSAAAGFSGETAGGAAPPLPRPRPACAITFMATTPMPAWFSLSMAGPSSRGRGVAVLRLDDIQLGFDDPIDHGRQLVRAHADKPHLALLLGLALRLHQLVADLLRACPFMCSSHTSRWSVLISLRLVSSSARMPAPRGSYRTCSKERCPSASLPAPPPPCARSGRSSNCGKYAIVDAHVGRPGDHGRIRGNHANRIPRL